VVEGALLWRLQADLMAEETAQRLLAELQRQASGEHVDGRRIAGLEKRAATLATEISRTVGLASRIDDPAPVLRRVSDLEAQRAAVARELETLRQQQRQQSTGDALTIDTVRDLLRRLFLDLRGHVDDDRRDEARVMLQCLLERIELDPATRVARLHYRLAAGDAMATPTAGQAPPVHWVSEATPIQKNPGAAA
jgi:hypothetical protein